MTLFVVAVSAASLGALTAWLFLRSSGVDENRRSDQRRSSGPHPDVDKAVGSPAKTRHHIERALADLRLGVVIYGADSAEIYRNNVALEFATGRHGNAIVEAAVERVVEGAFLGLSLEESVDLYGPPSRNLMVEASPTYDAGQIGGSVVVIEDVSENRHLDRVRSDFVANVSHELRTPIGALSVLAETIQQADGDEARSRLAARMVREAHRLSDTIDDLLSLARLESGPIVEPEIMDLASVVTMAVERTAESADQRSITLLVNNQADAPIFVSGDQAQLVSAVANLCDNALKYSDEHQQIAINLSSEPAEESQEAVLTVTDSGPGIPARDLDRIFERFYRVDSARSRDTGGTGLGLSIVRNVVQNHHGSVDVESREGVGSTFTIRLPLAEALDRRTIESR